MELKDNLKALEELFHDFAVVDQRKIWMRALRRASNPLVSSAKAGAPRGATGNLEHSIGVANLTNEIGVLIGARKGGGFKGWHAHLLESGTKERFRKNGGSTGSIRATRFFETAFNNTQEEMYDGVANRWYEEIDKFIIKAQQKKL